MKKKETFTVKTDYTIENSFGVIDSGDNVDMEITLEVDTENEHGWFELYIEEEDIYDEGTLEIEGNKITGYDGVFDLPKEITDKLVEWGLDISEL